MIAYTRRVEAMGDYILGTIILVAFWGMVYKYYREYKNSEYCKMTHNSLWDLYRDKGKLGEYYLYRKLNKLDGNKKYLFNCYIPKEDGLTTEIDVILLHESGVYVFESKNYSGWIFGTETQRQWTQVLPAGRGKSHKEYFMNPIIQNKVHLKWLKAYLSDFENIPFYSYIIFSERCELKDITLTSDQHYVIQRYEVFDSVVENVSLKGKILTEDVISKIYDKLYPLTQVDKATPIAHIHAVQEKRNIETSFDVTPKKKVETKAEKQTESSNEAEKTCPCCGNKMVLRTSTKGKYSGNQFYGCTNYPNCRYIEKLTK